MAEKQHEDLAALAYDLIADSQAQVDGVDVILTMPLQRLVDLGLAAGIAVEEVAILLNIEIEVETTEGDHGDPANDQA